MVSGYVPSFHGISSHFIILVPTLKFISSKSPELFPKQLGSGITTYFIIYSRAPPRRTGRSISS